MIYLEERISSHVYDLVTPTANFEVTTHCTVSDKSKMTASKKLKKLVDKTILRKVAESETDPTAYYELR